MRLSRKRGTGDLRLSRRLKLPKSAVHRLIRTVVAEKFVEQCASRRSRLGMRVLELGNMCWLRLDLVKVADPILKQLSARVEANAHLGAS